LNRTPASLPFSTTVRHDAAWQLLTEVARKARAVSGWKGDANSLNGHSTSCVAPLTAALPCRCTADSDFIEIIKAVVRGMGETSSKGARGDTPADYDVFVAQAFGVPGGKVDRVYAAVRAAVKVRPPYLVLLLVSKR